MNKEPHAITPKASDGTADHLQSRNIDLFIIQPTPFCNLDCDYCYLPDRSNRGKIDYTTLEAAFATVLGSELTGKQITVVWHAGEPLILPPGFYRHAFEIAHRYTPAHTRLTHSIQTNAVLIDKAWCQLFQQYPFQVGISVDGPEFLHDAHRKTRDGKGTWRRVMAGIEMLQRAGIDFHVITVLTSDSLRFPDEMFDFYMEHGIDRIAFNIEEIEGSHPTSSLDTDAIEALFRAFLDRFFDLAKPHNIMIREERNAAAALLHGDSRARPNNHQVRPFGIISVDYRGNISTFSPELLGQPNARFNNFIFGNVHNDSPLTAIAEHPAFQQVNQAIESGVVQCRQSCPWFSYCGGGGPSNKFFEHGRFDVTETLYCRLTHKVVLDLAIERLERNRSSPAPTT